MLVLFCTTVQRSMRQTRIKTQNIIVLTVEFTRIPLFTAGGEAATTAFLDIEGWPNPVQGRRSLVVAPAQDSWIRTPLFEKCFRAFSTAHITLRRRTPQ
jgi:hypothetical protein